MTDSDGADDDGNLELLTEDESRTLVAKLMAQADKDFAIAAAIEALMRRRFPDSGGAEHR